MSGLTSAYIIGGSFACIEPYPVIQPTLVGLIRALQVAAEFPTLLVTHIPSLWGGYFASSADATASIGIYILCYPNYFICRSAAAFVAMFIIVDSSIRGGG